MQRCGKSPLKPELLRLHAHAGHSADHAGQPEHGMHQQVCDFFWERLALLSSHGVTTDQVALDPGIGFGKALGHT